MKTNNSDTQRASFARMPLSYYRLSTVISCAVLLMLFLLAAPTSQAQLLFDTGPGLNNFGDLALSPGPTDPFGGYQWLAGEFHLNSVSKINAAQGWITIALPGAARISIARDNGGIPGETLFSDLFSSSRNLTPTWLGVDGENWNLEPGNY